MSPTDYEISEAMSLYGGSFAKAIARAWQAGDTINQARIKAAFPDLWRTYKTLLEEKAGGHG